jgi:hypothetical protein
MWNIWRDEELLSFFRLKQGANGVPGGSVANEDTPRDPCKRTCVLAEVVLHVPCIPHQSFEKLFLSKQCKTSNLLNVRDLYIYIFTCPCLKRKNERSSSPLQMFHTHVPLPRGFFQWITIPLLEAKKRKKFFISSDVPHTRPDAARLFSRCLFIYIYTRPGPNKPT